MEQKPRVKIILVNDDWAELWLNDELIFDGHTIDIRSIWALGEHGVIEFTQTSEERDYG